MTPFTELPLRTKWMLERPDEVSIRTISPQHHDTSRLVFGSGLSDPIAAEEYRIIARKLRARFPQGGVFAITSPVAGEGKTVTATNLALAFADESVSTILADMDLRCPAVKTRFGIEYLPAIEQVLSGAALPIEAVRRLTGTDLHICLAAGGHNATKLLSKDSLAPMIDWMRRMHKFVILDTPPVMPAADMMEIAPISDAVLMVVRENHTERDLLARALERLSGSRCAVLLNDSSSGGVASKYASRYYRNAH